MLAGGFSDLFFDAAPHLEYFFNCLSSALKWHLLKRHLTLLCKYDPLGVCVCARALNFKKCASAELQNIF